MNKSKKEYIIESFQKMDSNMLDILLDDNKTYQDVTKEVFLGKLDVIFSKLKENGDTFLFSHKGFCNSNECNNKGCKGYSFVGNKSKEHIDLIFKELDDDVNDIYQCSDFQLNNECVDMNNLLWIDIKIDEKANFKPSINFSIKNQNCKLAHEELVQYQNTVIGKEVYLEWLEKFYDLYQSFNLPPLFYVEFYKFYQLYGRINELKVFLQSSDFAKHAITEFQSIDKNNESQLLKWLIKYEKTGNNLIGFSSTDFDFENPEKREYFEIDNFKINTSDFKHIIKFKFLFDEYYWNLLDKYTTFSDEEATRHINENSEMSEYIISLTYHLDKRGFF